jgi:hypothetical protein
MEHKVCQLWHWLTPLRINAHIPQINCLQYLACSTNQKNNNIKRVNECSIHIHELGFAMDTTRGVSKEREELRVELAFPCYTA